MGELRELDEDEWKVIQQMRVLRQTTRFGKFELFLHEGHWDRVTMSLSEKIHQKGLDKPREVQ